MNRRGFALEAALFVILLIAVLVAVSVTGVVAVTKTAGLDYRNARVSYAAEAGADAIMAQLADALEDGALSDAELSAVAPPSIPGFTYDAVTVNRIGGVAVETITDGPFAGLYSLTQSLEIHSKVRDAHNNGSEVVVTAKAQAIPIFQFGIFFEKDLEITNGPAMDFDGWIHSNGNIYMSSNNAWYHDIVTTPNKIIHNRKDKNDVLNGVYVDDAYGNSVQLTFDSRSYPNPVDFRNQSHTNVDDRIKTDAYSVDTLRVPLPAGMPARAVMEPRDPADNDLVRKAKYAWKADWYLVVDLSSPATTCANIGALSIRDAGLVVPSATDCATIFQMSVNKFWEGRQLTSADVFDINMGQLFAWVAGDAAQRKTSVLYVAFRNLGAGDYPVVRVRNGATLQYPITIATDRPFYIWGDYNSNPTQWQPSAVVGDAITFLSNAWTDGAHAGPGLTNASDTDIYTAILAGHSATPWDWFDAGIAPYGGGVENYPRFIEKWSGRTSTYYGSLVSLSTSAFATAAWSYGVYYTAPTRNWRFDMRFENPEDLPPGTPTVGNVIHTAFRPVY